MTIGRRAPTECDEARGTRGSARLVLFAGEVFPVKHLRNLKALLPEPCRLSLPKVSHERPSSEEEEGVVQRFAIGADTFEVTVKSAA